MTREQKADVKQKVEHLRNNYNISRNFWYVSHPGFPKRDNITLHHGEMKLIDFGPPWKIRRR
jgi:hypothetical protein